MGFDLDKWYLSKCEGDIIYKFKGNVSHESIVKALKIVEETLFSYDENNKIRKKVFSIFVESVQNLFHHVDNPPPNENIELADNFGIIILAKDSLYPYRLSTGNFIKIDKVKHIKERIDQIKVLSENEVKMLYREVLANREYSQKGGGGLGIIDIARKSGNKIEYNTYNFDNEYVFFALDIFIS